LDIEFHPDALAETLAARDWYLERSPAAAKAFVKEIENGLEQIAEAPLLRTLYLSETRQLLLRHFPFALVYLIANEKIFIVAVAHGKRRPGYWKKRL
jgi:plasmid stabilization system protein ParE